MAELFQFELVSPERQLLSKKVAEVTVPGSEGEFGVLKNHSPFMSTLKPGVLTVRLEDGSKLEYFVAGGFADAAPTGLTVLAEEAVPFDDLTAEMLDEQIAAAEKIAGETNDDLIKQKAEELASRLKVVQGTLKAA
ncbi:MAG: F0F1 ATP synthase subunit epsilon [Rhodobacteraceae bacterium]|nr:F0F1 ATP synthase subunit epsilon [Paracoccaceae bacterium]